MSDILWIDAAIHILQRIIEAMFNAYMNYLGNSELQKKSQAYDIQVRETQALEAQVREDQAREAQAREAQARKAQARKDYWQNFAYAATLTISAVGIFFYVKHNPDIIQKIQNVAKIGK